MNPWMNDNVIASTVHLISQLQIKVATSSIRDVILKNSNYPSLLAISESLNYWKIDSEAYQLDKGKLGILPTPFIAQLRDNNGQLVVVKKVSDDTVTYVNDGGAEQLVSNLEFLGRWNGVALLAEASEHSGQKDYEKILAQEKLKRNWITAFISLIIFASLTQFFITASKLSSGNLIYNIGIWLFTLCGTIFSSLLLWHEYDENNTYLKKICSINKKANCNSILTSKAAKIAGFSWAEVGGFYFFGSLFYLLITPYSTYFQSPLILLNVITFPYILFSLYYQGMVIKQWCVLCLAVQGILLLEFLTVLLTGQLDGNFIAQFEQVNYSSLAISFLLLPLLWIVIKPFIYDKKGNDELKYNFFRFKNNADVFNSILAKQVEIKNEPAGLGISLGNMESGNILVKVCNPYCGPCGRSFPDLLDVIIKNRDIKAQIVFTGRPDKNDPSAIIIAHFLEIYENRPELTEQALTDWYASEPRDYEKFAQKYKEIVDFENFREKIGAMHFWCQSERIQYTPTYYFNGRRLPDSYNLKDLQGMFDYSIN